MPPIAVRHQHQSMIPNDPSKDISSNEWNAEHIVEGVFVCGTAAELAVQNLVLLAGQSGYETDTLSIKIGDGATAYNTLSYFYRGLPVAGELSLGTPHPHFYSFYPAANFGPGTQTIDAIAVGGCPVGSKMIYINYEYLGPVGYAAVHADDMSGNVCVRAISNGLNFYATGAGLVKLDASGKFNMVASLAVTLFTLTMNEYWI